MYANVAYLKTPGSGSPSERTILLATASLEADTKRTEVRSTNYERTRCYRKLHYGTDVIQLWESSVVVSGCPNRQNLVRCTEFHMHTQLERQHCNATICASDPVLHILCVWSTVRLPTAFGLLFGC